MRKKSFDEDEHFTRVSGIRVLAIAEDLVRRIEYESIGRKFSGLDVTAVTDRDSALSAVHARMFDVIVVDSESAQFAKDSIEWIRYEESSCHFTPQ
jgi:hypothetical protein